MRSSNVVFGLFKSARKKNISKLYMIAKGHWLPVYGIGNECA